MIELLKEIQEPDKNGILNFLLNWVPLLGQSQVIAAMEGCDKMYLTQNNGQDIK